MIYDSQGQKEYLLTCVRKCREWNHEESIQLANQYGQRIATGPIVDPAKADKAFPQLKLQQPAQTQGANPAMGDQQARTPGADPNPELTNKQKAMAGQGVGGNGKNRKTRRAESKAEKAKAGKK